MEQNAAWEQVTALTTLNIVSHDTSQPQIYANGRHQAVVDVFLTPINVDREVIEISSKELLDHVTLVDYETGGRLGGSSSEGWGWSAKNGNYPVLNTRGDVGVAESIDADRGNFVRLYVTCSNSAQMQSMDVAVTITLSNGKQVSTRRGEMTGDRNKVHVATIPPVDYGRPEIWDIQQGSFDVVAKDINCLSYQASPVDPTPTWVDDWIGESRWKKIAVKLIQAPTRFKLSATPDPKHLFEKIHSEMFRRGASLPLLGKAQAYAGCNRGEAFDVLIWYIDPDSPFGIKPNADLLLKRSSLASTNRWIHIDKNDLLHKASPSTRHKGEFHIYLWNLRVPVSGLEHSGWNNEDGVRKVLVSDNFGNQSILKMRFDYDSLLPALID
ncbi:MULTISPECIES: hypothetical protein [unclassified Caballeronia]|uniref:hypothetical protein n=1 Tax=unclassified Caballeronia TaxID=2646786 RepID=UPI00285E87AB|nr:MULTISPECIES: hypothetical protein [unclassified Caballeronia]MDR5775588.1 hypothetical protein [Caballeronia sp. LZ002]MDR5802317.1 hypothetical protein [Caballeronia sp. LZ001]MDR5851026.1 hypothetical protein [Caballeronia sp. LZ003]